MDFVRSMYIKVGVQVDRWTAATIVASVEHGKIYRVQGKDYRLTFHPPGKMNMTCMIERLRYVGDDVCPNCGGTGYTVGQIITRVSGHGFHKPDKVWRDPCSCCDGTGRYNGGCPELFPDE